jgi:hypothetical protein
MEKNKQKDAGKQLLLLLVVAVLLVSLVGTWLVLQNSFSGAPAASRSGVVTFNKVSPSAPAVAVGRTVETATVSFIKQG